jgi:serine phosphatase RsbU (regulator of sigma subunit)
VPLLVGADGGVRPAELAPSPPIGVRGATYHSAGFTLAAGEGMVIYSDGLIERRDEDLSDSLRRLAGEVARLWPSLSAGAVFAAHEHYDATDDRTVVVLRRSSSTH